VQIIHKHLSTVILLIVGAAAIMSGRT